MFTLGIIDKIKPEDLTGGKIIAGTGTIDDLGQVGPIGGIAQKIVAAKNAGAQFFLTPTDNCAEAVGAQAPGLPLVRGGHPQRRVGGPGRHPGRQDTTPVSGRRRLSDARTGVLSNNP